ncbi:DUF2637 domain-containing protein [Streptomyces sp. NPDC055025]
MKKDLLLTGSLAAVLIVLASAEYQLARACGFGEYVAAAVPVALDLYVVKALRVKRDVTAAVLALVAVNAASHLVTAGVLPVGWPLIVAVSSIAPLVLWRIHRLGEEPTDLPEEGLSEPADHFREAPEVIPVPEVTATPAPAVPEAVPPGARLLPVVCRRELVTPAAPVVPFVPDDVTTEVTIERLVQPPEQAVIRPAVVDTWRAIDWSRIGTSVTAENAAKTPTAKAVQEARQVVTVPVTITPAELRKQARKLNREMVTATGKPVTIDRLRDEYGLSRRDATELRRTILDGSRS